MNGRLRWRLLGITVLQMYTAMPMSGCAAEGPKRPAGLEQKIETARARADHEETASIYEQQAIVDKAAAERHESLARQYQRSGGGFHNINGTMARHCLKLTNLYRQAEQENLALAKTHRQLAEGAKE